MTAAPALVTPLAKRRIQIQPPGKTWCTAASSIGYGGVAVRRVEGIPPLDAGEVPVEPLRPRQPAHRRLGQAERLGQEPARPAGVDQEPGPHVDRFIAPLALEHDARALEAHLRQRQLVDVAHAFALGFAHQPVIEVGTIPVRVGDGVVGARRDDQLTRVRGGVLEAPIEIVAEEREPALEAAGDVGIRRAPRPPLRERADPRQIPAIRQLLEHEVGDRRRRFADREARMPAALEQRHRAALPAEDQRGQRPGEAGADDRDVGVDRVPRHRCQAGGAPDASHAAQAAHATGAGTRCSRLRRSSRARRASRHAGQVANVARSHRSARTRARPDRVADRLRRRVFERGQRRRREQTRPPPGPPSRPYRRGSESARSPTRRRRWRRRSIAAATASARRAARTAGARAGTRAGRRRAPRARAPRPRSRPACSPCSGARARRGARSRAPSRPRATAPADRGTATCDRRPAADAIRPSGARRRRRRARSRDRRPAAPRGHRRSSPRCRASGVEFG